MRFDLQIIASWIEPGAKVLDLGCGEGNLLYFLNEEKSIHGTGIESREDKVAQCIASGLSVLQGDINTEVVDYPDNVFDYVILSQTLQQVYEPETLIAEPAPHRQAGDRQFSQLCPLAQSPASPAGRESAGKQAVALRMV